MQKYLSKVNQLMAGLQSFEVVLVPRTENMAADALSKRVSSSTTDLKRNVVIEILPERTRQRLTQQVRGKNGMMRE